MSSGNSNWDDANTSCAEMGMSLALRNIIDDFSTVLSNSEGHFWIGLRREVGQSGFIWNDGVMLTESINLGMGNNDCGEISNGILSNQFCNSNQQYICQRTGENTSYNKF